jgi:hypothetical protein
MEQTPESRALEDLDSLWGDLYDVGFREGRYFARRVDGTGKALTAGTPEGLDAAIRADQSAR